MKTVRDGLTKLVFLWRDELVSFHDKAALLQTLSGLITNETQLKELQTLLGVERLSPEATLELAADQIVANKLLLAQGRVSRSAAFEEAEALTAPVPKKATGPPPTTTPTQTWVEFELIDEEGVPVAGEHYKVTLPDGAVKTGSLDNKGHVRFNKIPSGTCTISFPDLDRNRTRKN